MVVLLFQLLKKIIYVSIIEIKVNKYNDQLKIKHSSVLEYWR